MSDATVSEGRPRRVVPSERAGAVQADVGALVGARVAVAVLGWSGTLLVVRHLDSTNWGEFSLVFNLLGLLLILTSAVSTRSAIKGYLDDADPARFIGSYILLRFALGLIGYVAVVGFVLAAGYPATVQRATIIGGLVVVISSVSNGYELVFSVEQRLYRMALAQSAGQAAQFALTACLAAVGTGVVGFTLPAILCEVVILAVVTTSVRRTIAIRYRVVLSSWGGLARAAVPLALGQAFFTLAYSIDSVILSKLQPFEAVGVYSIAYKFAGVVVMIPLAVGLAVTGRLVVLWPERAVQFWLVVRQAALALLVAASLIVVEFALFAHPIIATLYGRTYDAGAEASVLVVAGACLSFFTSLAITVLTAQGRNAWYPAAGAIALAVNVGLNLWLIPRYSYLAAAWVTVITEVVALAVLLPSLLRGRWPAGREGHGPPASAAVHRWAALRPVALTAATTAVTAGAGLGLRSVVAWPVAAVASSTLFVVGVHVLRVPGEKGLRSILEAGDDPSEVPPGLPLAARLPAGTTRWALGVTAAVAAVAAGVSGHAVYLVAAAVAVPAIGWILRRPQRGVLFLVAAVPFDGLLELVSSSGVVRSWKEAVVIVLLLATVVCPQGARAQGRRGPATWAAPLGLLLLYSLATIPFFGIHTGLTGFRIEYFYVLVPVVVWRCPLSRRDLDRLVSILMVVAAVTAAYGVAQELMGGARLHSLGYPYNSTIRFTGSHLRAFSTFAQPFPFAYFLMMVVLLGLAVSLSDLSRRRSRWFMASLPLLGAGILFAFVRGAWLGLGAGLVYLVLRRYRKVVLAAPILLLAVLFVPSSLSGSLFQSHSLGQRTSGWSQNLARVESSPFGQGLASSGAAAEAAVSPAAANAALNSGFVPGAAPYQPDNDYYNVVFELGLPGLWFFLLFMLQAVGSADRRARSPSRPGQARWRASRPSFETDLALGVAAFLLAVMAASLVSTFFEIFPLNVYIYLLIGVVATLPRDASTEGTAPSATGTGPSATAPGAAGTGRHRPPVPAPAPSPPVGARRPVAVGR